MVDISLPSGFFLNLFYFIFMSMGVLSACISVHHQKRASDSLELEL